MDSPLSLHTLILPYVLFFARTTALFLIVPGMGETIIPPRFRLMIALGLSAALTPFVPITAPSSEQPILFLLTVGQEVIIGFMIGLVGKIILSLLDIAGTIIGMQIGLGNAMMFNPNFSGQMPLTGHFLILGGTLLFFTLDLHHLVLHTLVKSYQVFPTGEFFFKNASFKDAPIFLIQLMGKAFYLGVQMSLPFLILGTVFQFFLGLLNRLVPSLQVFFIMLPAQLFMGLFLMMVCFGFILKLALDVFQQTFLNFPGFIQVSG